MAKFQPRGDQRSVNTNFDDSRQFGVDIIQSSLLTGVGVMASMADAARTFWQSIADREQMARAELGPGLVSRLSTTIAGAAGDALGGVVGASTSGVRRSNTGNFGSKSRRRRRAERRADSTSRSTVGGARAKSTASAAQQEIIDSAEDFLVQVEANGAVLDSVVDHVALDRDLDRSIVRSVITRHFINNGKVILNQQYVDESRPVDPVLDWFKDELKRLGYNDVRKDYELTGFRDLDEEAALIAFVDEEPYVLCYPVNDGEVGDAAHREAARFQAGSVAPDKSAHYAWVSDGVSSYIYDLEDDRVVPRLPKYSDTLLDDLDMGSKVTSDTLLDDLDMGAKGTAEKSKKR